MDLVGFDILPQGSRLIERTGHAPGNRQDDDLFGWHTELLHHADGNIGVIGHQSQVDNRCVFRPGNDDHGSQSLFVQLGCPEWPGVDIRY